MLSHGLFEKREGLLAAAELGVQDSEFDGRDVVVGGLAGEIADLPTEHGGIAALLKGKADVGGSGFVAGERLVLLQFLRGLPGLAFATVCLPECPVQVGVVGESFEAKTGVANRSVVSASVEVGERHCEGTLEWIELDGSLLCFDGFLVAIEGGPHHGAEVVCQRLAPGECTLLRIGQAIGRAASLPIACGILTAQPDGSACGS